MQTFLASGYTVMVDDADFERVMQFKWRSQAGKYFKRSGAAPVTLARFIMQLPPYKIDKRQVSYKDKNCCDNRRSNLVIYSPIKLARMYIRPNPISGYYGVSFNKAKNRWCAYISYHGNQNIFAGSALTAIEAAVLYDKKAVELFGSDTTLNFPLVA